MGGGGHGRAAACGVGSGGGGGVIDNLKKRLWEIVAVGGFFAVAWLGWEVRDYFGQKEVSEAIAQAKSETESELRNEFATTLLSSKAEANAAGYARGQSELALSRSEDEALAKLLIGAFTLLQNPDVLAQFSVETAKSIRDAGEAVRRKDFSAATELLPPEISYAMDTECVEPKGLFRISEDQRFNLCGTNEVFIVTSIQYGVISFSVDGEGLRVSYAQRQPFSDNCFVAYERRIETDEVLKAEVRFGCK
jgi:hypothetical protein